MKSGNSYSLRSMAVCRVEMDSRKGGGMLVVVAVEDMGSCSRANLRNACACDATVYYCQHSKHFI